jgi:4-aminobutyrate aminotransferase-like enzyme
MRDKKIQMTTDGPHGNVIKIKPPLVFSKTDADLLVEALDQILDEDALRQPR